MTRGVAHSPELKAQVVAAILAGTSIVEAARQFGVSKSLVSEWASSDERVRTVRTIEQRSPEAIAALLYDLIADLTTAIRAQIQTASREDYVRQQSAGDLADLVGTERDTLIRLLAGLVPHRDPEPAALDSAPAPGPADG